MIFYFRFKKNGIGEGGGNGGGGSSVDSQHAISGGRENGANPRVHNRRENMCSHSESICKINIDSCQVFYSMGESCRD